MQPEAQIATIAHVIQLAVAPVFLLTGIATMLAVLTNRLGRIIDRARAVESIYHDKTDEHRAMLSADLLALSSRASLINQAITLFTAAALLVCLLIMSLFVGAFLEYDASRLVATFFVVTMLSVIVGLIYFIREVRLATTSLRIGLR